MYKYIINNKYFKKRGRIRRDEMILDQNITNPKAY